MNPLENRTAISQIQLYSTVTVPIIARIILLGTVIINDESAIICKEFCMTCCRRNPKARGWGACYAGRGPVLPYINPLKTKRRLLYLKTQFVPRSKHFIKTNQFML